MRLGSSYIGVGRWLPWLASVLGLNDFDWLLRLEAENASRHKVTANGNAQLDGNGNCVFDGTNSRLNTPYSPDFSLDNGDYTISFFVKFDSLSLQMITQSNSTSAQNYGSWWVRLESDNSLRFLIDKGSAAESLQTSASAISVDTEYFIEIVRQFGGTNRIFIDGIQKASGSDGSYNAVANSGFDIGAQNDNSSWVNGAISRFHLQKGVASRTSADSYTPPARTDTIPTDNPYTVLALDFAGTAASQRIIDLAKPDDTATPGLLPDVSGNEVDLTPSGSGVTYNESGETISFDGSSYAAASSFIQSGGTVYLKATIDPDTVLQSAFGDANAHGGLTSAEYLYGNAGTELAGTVDVSGVEHVFAFDFTNGILYVDGAQVASGTIGAGAFAAFGWGAKSDGSDPCVMTSKTILVDAGVYDSQRNAAVMAA